MAKQTFTTGQVLTAAQMTSLQQTALGGGATTAKTSSYVLVAADAGTVVQMNAAGATTITVNTALFSAGDTVQIQNVGAGVCTVTAGTATVSTAGSLALSQYEGGQLYFNTTSAALFFDIVQTSGMTNPMTTTGDIIYSSSGSTPARLGIGTTGQILKVASGLPSWATSSASGMVLVTTGSFAGSSTSVNNCFSSTYDNYLMIFEVEVPTGSAGDFNYRFRTSGTDNSTGNYNLTYMDVSSSPTSGTSSGQTNNRFGALPSAGGEARFHISVFTPFATKKTAAYALGNRTNLDNINGSLVWGAFGATTSFDGFTAFSSGSVAFTGTYYIYGLAK